MLTCAACAPARTSQPTWQAAGAVETQQISVLVENLTWDDVVVYSRVHQFAVRLGMVVSGVTGRFRIPPQHQFSPDLKLFASPVGSPGGYSSGQINANPGQQVRWTVHRNPALRTLIVR